MLLVKRDKQLNWSNTTGHLVKIDKLSKEVIYDKDQSQI